jgi:pimeloyl-ACP methyl ester carboxylesterase
MYAILTIVIDWGVSYGTMIGQYLIKILPSERIGRVIIDGVLDPDVWTGYANVATRRNSYLYFVRASFLTKRQRGSTTSMMS